MDRRLFSVLSRVIPALLILGSILVASGSWPGKVSTGDAAPAPTATVTATATVPVATTTATVPAATATVPAAATATVSPTTTATVAATATPVPAGPVAVTVTPGQTSAGSTIAVAGAGYQPGESIALELATTGAGSAVTQLPPTVHADANGKFSAPSVSIPASTPAGNYMIIALGLTSNRSAHAPLSVTAPKATLTVDPTTFAPDDSIQVSGTNFLPGEAVNIALTTTTGSTSITLGQVHADNSGNIGPGKIQVPFGVTSGAMQLVATGQSSNRTATVAVTIHAPTASLIIAPTSAKPNQTIAVTGTHFQPGEPITIDLVTLSTTIRVGNATANAAGEFTVGSVKVPANTPQGAVTLVATGATSRLSATAQLAVGVNAATLVASPTTVTAGSAISLTGTGFIPGETATVVITGTHLAAITLAALPIGSDGSFKVNGLAIPAFIPAGSYSISALGQKSGRSATTALTVQAPAPAAPILSILGITQVAGQQDVLSPGGLVQIAGSHYPAGAVVTVALVGAQGTVALGNVKATAQGAIGPVSLSIPVNVSVGAYTLETLVGGTKNASVTVKVAILTPHITAGQSSLTAGGTIVIQGTGFAPGEQLVVALNSAALVTSPAVISANSSGAFTATFTVPNTITQGANVLTVTGATSRAGASLTLQAAHLTATTWYFADGDTTGGIRTVISLLNPSAGQAKVTLTFLYQTSTQRSTVVAVPAHGILQVDLGLTAGQGRHISTIVSADRQIGAQSNIYYPGADGSSALGASAPAKLWYLAEGYTGGTFHEYLDVMNPSTAVASVDVRFLPFNGKPLKEERFTVNARSTIRVDAGQYVPGQSIGAIVSANQGVVVERTLRFGAGGRGADDTIGIASSSTVWLFAQGNTAADRQTFLTILNPNQASAATVTATLFDSNGKPVGMKTVVVDALHRGNIKLNSILSSADVAVSVTSSVPVVVERPQYVGPADLGKASSGSDVFGRNGAGASWTFPSGNTSGGNQESLYFYNPGVLPVAVQVTFYTNTGATVQQSITLAPNSRSVMSVNQVAGLPAGPFGAVARSTDGRLFVAEQSTLNGQAQRYSSTQGIAQ